jgi:hypothetical protein
LLNENSIAQTLQEIVEDLQQGYLQNARTRLDVLEFERLRHPISDPTKQRLFVDPAGPFGTERVNETGDHILQCEAALSRVDGSAALEAAQKALQRWQEG